MEKTELRKLIKERRNTFSKKELASLSDRIADNLFKLEELAFVKNVLIYVSTNVEVDTRKLILKFFEAGVNVYVPRVVDLGQGLMRFFKINSLEDLEPGCMKILEPKLNLEELDEARIDDSFCIIMPGLSFDKKGHRLGYGGGFYDRFNARVNPKLLKVALSFEFQLVDELIANEFDIDVDKVITEKEIINCK